MLHKNIFISWKHKHAHLNKILISCISKHGFQLYLLTYLLTPCSRVLLEKLTSPQLVKKFPAFYGTFRFITAFTSVWRFHNKVSFFGEELLAPRPTPKQEDHPLSAVRGCWFNIFAAILHYGGCSSIRNLRMCHAVVTGTHLSWGLQFLM